MKALLLPLAAAILLSACNHLTNPRKETTMTQNERPVLTAPEVLTKVLDFIRTAQSPEDFNITKAEEVMKMKFVINEKADYRNGGGSFYALNDFKGTDWSWFIKFRGKEDPYMQLIIGNGYSRSPATPICEMDLDQFHPMLEQAGFTYTGKGHWGRPFNGYVKDYPNGYHADVRVFYRGESAEKILHKCINEITFDIYKIGE